MLICLPESADFGGHIEINTTHRWGNLFLLETEVVNTKDILSPEELGLDLII